ncbi:MAG: hypothetical protein ACM3ZT_06920 [Bacillota bacterium]
MRHILALLCAAALAPAATCRRTAAWGPVGDSFARPAPQAQEEFQSLTQEIDARLRALRAFDDLKVKDKGAYRPGKPLLRLGLQRRDKDR